MYFHGHNSVTSAKSIIALNINTYYHVVVVFSNSTAKFYINGVLDNIVSGNYSIPDDLYPDATTIGAWLAGGGGRYFDGIIDDIRIYNHALTDAEILTLYHEGGWGN